PGLAEWSQDLQDLLDDEFTQLEADRETLRREIFKTDRNEAMLLLIIAYLETHARQQFHIDHRKPSDLSPEGMIPSVWETLAELQVIRGLAPISMTAQHNARMLFSIHLRAYLASKHVIETLRINKAAFKWIPQDEYLVQVLDELQRCQTPSFSDPPMVPRTCPADLWDLLWWARRL
ncbi:DNA-directed RNA polymerase II core subunit rpo21, partial [Tilletia horrida]